MYSSNFSPIECNNFTDKIIHFIPHTDNDWRDCCDSELHIEELDSKLVFKEWVDRNIWSVLDLLDESGNMDLPVTQSNSLLLLMQYLQV